MIWTKELPRIVGYYWVRTGGRTQIVRVLFQRKFFYTEPHYWNWSGDGEHYQGPADAEWQPVAPPKTSRTASRSTHHA